MVRLLLNSAPGIRPQTSLLGSTRLLKQTVTSVPQWNLSRIMLLLSRTESTPQRLIQLSMVLTITLVPALLFTTTNGATSVPWPSNLPFSIHGIFQPSKPWRQLVWIRPWNILIVLVSTILNSCIQMPFPVIQPCPIRNTALLVKKWLLPTLYLPTAGLTTNLNMSTR